ncbi:MAG TPA: nicotinate (nicotinamide) nucleotide adenylyltransferase [Sphaerochaeta sp.]|nr:nicotinate (nicotinamide) nucleotide adenylyltransferase [Sphaerochaeta sp.]
MRPMPTAMVGGSFDPIHRGHLHLLHTVATRTAYRRLILVPVGRNNFKPDAQPAPAQHRLAMIRLALDHYRTLYPLDSGLELVVDECELNRTGISYTYDTVKDLYRLYPIEGRLAVVMGDDLLPDLGRWHNFDTLKKLVTFVVIRREEHGQRFFDESAELIYLDNALMEDSSTKIRDGLQQVASGQALPDDLASLMSPEVVTYIEREQLYRH